MLLPWHELLTETKHSCKFLHPGMKSVDTSEHTVKIKSLTITNSPTFPRLQIAGGSEFHNIFESDQFLKLSPTFLR